MVAYRSLASRVGNVVRLAEVVRVLVRHGFADLVGRLGLAEGLPAKALRGLRLLDDPTIAPDTLGARLRAALTELGPTFVKFGQILSTRPDLMGAAICSELSALQDNVTALPFSEMHVVLENSLKGTVTDRFESFDETPIAAASLSQVYRATTKDGHGVAVKVQRPNARRVIESDLRLLLGVAEWIAEHVTDVQWMDPVGMVEELERSILRELDFTIEARTIERFRENYSDDDTVFIPNVYGALSDAHVLTMDWIDGVRIDALEEYPARNCDPSQVAVVGCDTLCKQVFEYRFFHADPHPGNVFVLHDNRIAFLDYGMIGYLERADVQALADLLYAVFTEDSARCVQALLLFTTADEVADEQALEHEVAEYIAFEAQAVMGNADIGRALRQITDVLRRHRLQLAPRFSLLFKALATIESTARVLDSNADMTPVIQPYVDRLVTNRLAPQNILHEGQHHFGSIMRFLRAVPSDLQSILRHARKGTLTFQLNHLGTERIADVIDRASNRLAYAMIAGSLIIGSSLLLATYPGAKSIGIIGFTIAAVLGLVLLVSIIRSKNY